MKGIEAPIIAVLAVLVSTTRRLPARRLSSGITTLTLAGIVLLVAAGGASADYACVADDGSGDAYFCGDTVMKNCTFNGSMTCPPGHGLSVGASGITIDGNDFALVGGSTTCAGCSPTAEGSPDSCDCGILSTGGRDDVVITNLEIKNFCSGIVIRGIGPTNPAEHNTIENCTIHDNGVDGSGFTNGIYLLKCADENTITGNDVYRNTAKSASGCSLGGFGIRLYGTSNHNNITHNNVYENEGAGIYSKMKCAYNRVAYNDVYSNGIDITQGEGVGFQSGGIRLECKATNYWIVEHNNISDNIGPGLFVRGCGNIIRYNNVTNCVDGTVSLSACTVDTAGGRGIVFHPDGTDSTIRNNHFCDNEREDIYVCPGHSMNGDSDDNTCDSASDYSDASATSPQACVFQCNWGPDLQIMSDDLNISWVVPEENYTINYTVCNTGNGVTANASLTGFYVNDVYQFNDPVPELDVGVCHNYVTDPIDFTGIATVRLLADYTNNETRDIRPSNNDYARDFGGPDLWVSYFWIEWVDLPMKTYNLVYTVTNTGDNATPLECRVNFTECNGEWSNCIDPVPVPVLDVGETYPATGHRTMGPFVMGDDSDWLEVRADYDHTIAQNVVDAVQDYNRINAIYADEGGPCKGCGDVNGDGDVDIRDMNKVLKRAGDPNYGLDCPWAADAKCDGDVDIRDMNKVLKRAGDPNYALNCCKGCDLW